MTTSMTIMMVALIITFCGHSWFVRTVASLAFGAMGVYLWWTLGVWWVVFLAIGVFILNALGFLVAIGTENSK